MLNIWGKIATTLVFVAAAAAGVRIYGAEQWRQGHAAAVSERTTRDAAAIIARTHDNAALAIQQEATNAIITKAKNEELAPVRTRIAAERVRVGSAICGGPAAATQAEFPAGGDGADPSARLVREDAERDIRALKLAVEEDLATGRACQEAARKNGLAP